MLSSWASVFALAIDARLNHRALAAARKGRKHCTARTTALFGLRGGILKDVLWRVAARSAAWGSNTAAAARIRSGTLLGVLLKLQAIKDEQKNCCNNCKVHTCSKNSSIDFEPVEPHSSNSSLCLPLNSFHVYSALHNRQTAPRRVLLTAPECREDRNHREIICDSPQSIG